jgi:ubiquinone/menaquinone biosynthesis C-methylase UbiE
VTAIEPNPIMQKQSLPRLKDAQVPIQIIEAGAESLPFPDESFDTVISTLVFCTIPDPIKALQEIRRVCKPGGKVLFFEHVRLSHSRLGRLQDNRRFSS